MVSILIPAATLTRDDVRARVSTIIVDVLQAETDPATIAETAALSDLGLDSLDTVDIIMSLEEDFSIEITDAAMDRVLTLGDATTVVIEALALAGRPVAGEVA